jgi:phosphonate transport system substrate-binding protein
MLSLLYACTKERAQTAAAAGYAQQEILIGLIPEQNVFRQQERYLVLKQYLADRLGVTITFTSSSRYGNIVERFSSEKLDRAFFGSFTYALAHHQLGVEPIARPINLDGTSTYRGYLFVHRDSRILGASDMRGKQFAFVERATGAGYLFPLAYFKAHHFEDVHAYFGETFFSGSHDAAILVVLNRDADIGAAKSTIYEQMVREHPRIGKELQVLAVSEVFPQNCLAVRKDLDPKLKTTLKQALLDMGKDSEGASALKKFGARGFIENSDGDYAMVYRLTAQAGIDMETYRNNNR